jgi:hypothetical protein
MMLLQLERLLFCLSTGESVLLSPDMISVQISGESAPIIPPEMVKECVIAVFHYFKHELDRHSVSVAEFSGALERVLRRFGLEGIQPDALGCVAPAFESDLRRLAQESGRDFELLFFSRLRDELNKQLRRPVRAVRFHGLRGCVKQLAGAQRWSQRCQTLRDQIVAYLRACICSDNKGKDCTLVVE